MPPPPSPCGCQLGCCFSCAATWRRGAGGFWGFIRAVDFEAFEVMGVEMNEETGEETGEDTESGDGGGSGGSGGSVGLSAAGGGKAPPRRCPGEAQTRNIRSAPGPRQESHSSNLRGGAELGCGGTVARGWAARKWQSLATDCTSILTVVQVDVA